MEEAFINEQAKRFASLVHAGVGKYDRLKALRERLYQELDNYINSNKIIFLQAWQQELNLLFESHLKRRAEQDLYKQCI